MSLKKIKPEYREAFWKRSALMEIANFEIIKAFNFGEKDIFKDWMCTFIEKYSFNYFTKLGEVENFRYFLSLDLTASSLSM